jgi:pimeloyl-ACP methyl ester carboxylesterase
MAGLVTRHAAVAADLRYQPVAQYRELSFTAQDGRRLYCRDYGDPMSIRPPLICLSGLTRNSKDFQDLATYLCGERRVVCPDYRGRGRSDYDANWRNYQPGVYVNDIRHLMAVTGVGRVVVVGTSLGGYLAMLSAVAAPGRFAGVVLNDIGPAIPRDGLEMVLAHIRTARSQPDWESAHRHMRRKLAWMSLGDDEAWAQFVANSYRTAPDGRLHLDWDPNLVRPLKRLRWPLPDLWPLYRALRHIPTLAIRGFFNDTATTETFDRMAAEKPGLRRITVPAVGHAPSLREPEAIGAIDDFLDTIG